MVTSAAWAIDDQDPVIQSNTSKWKSKANLFTAGFDRVAFGWSVRNTTFSKDEVKMSKLEKSKDSTF